MISKWIIKALVQKTISYLPGSRNINYFFQRNVTGAVHLTDEHFGIKLQHGRDHFQSFRTYSGVQSGTIILELGTGWYPIVPILFYLTSSGNVISVDIHNWLTLETQLKTFGKMEEWRERGLMDDLVPFINEKRWEKMLFVLHNPSVFSTDRINEMIGLTPMIQDARNLPLKVDTIDFICSNNTFEHVPEKVLRDILVEFKRVLKPGGMMSHFIDMSDHFAHFDHHISIYNFLKFSAKQWKLLDNSIQPQNRMRFRDYTEMYRELGLAASEKIISEGSIEELGGIKIHSDYSGYTEEELAISHAYIITS